VRRKIDIKDESKEVRTKSKVQIQSRGGVGGGRGGGWYNKTLLVVLLSK
jgi:hypothetical protein